RRSIRSRGPTLHAARGRSRDRRAGPVPDRERAARSVWRTTTRAFRGLGTWTPAPSLVREPVSRSEGETGLTLGTHASPWRCDSTREGAVLPGASRPARSQRDANREGCLLRALRSVLGARVPGVGA